MIQGKRYKPEYIRIPLSHMRYKTLVYSCGVVLHIRLYTLVYICIHLYAGVAYQIVYTCMYTVYTLVCWCCISGCICRNARSPPPLLALGRPLRCHKSPRANFCCSYNHHPLQRIKSEPSSSGSYVQVSVFWYFIQKKLKGIGPETIKLFKCPPQRIIHSYLTPGLGSFWKDSRLRSLASHK